MISGAAFSDCSASFRTSSATTVKPRPCVPALGHDAFFTDEKVALMCVLRYRYFTYYLMSKHLDLQENDTLIHRQRIKDRKILSLCQGKNLTGCIALLIIA